MVFAAMNDFAALTYSVCILVAILCIPKTEVRDLRESLVWILDIISCKWISLEDDT